MVSDERAFNNPFAWLEYLPFGLMFCHREPLTHNPRCNHDLKNLFKGAAIVASSEPGPFQEVYTALLAKGIRPEMTRLTLARKIATIVLIVWKRGACFDAQHLKPQTA
jgi:hypothetical protein